MATSKRSKKRPLSLSLSQPSGLETSRSRRKKLISSQDCDISNSGSKTLSVVSEEGDNPRRKFVEEWLEKNNADICTESNIEINDGNSQETVLLEGNCNLHGGDQSDEGTNQSVEGVKEVVPMEQDMEVKFEETAQDAVVEQDVIQGDLVRQEVAKDSVVKQELLEDNGMTHGVVEDTVVKNEAGIENEPGTSGESAADNEPLLQCPLCWKNFEKVQTQAAHLKSCAAANGLTTRQLIDAVDLHKKQLAERKRLGLFPMAAPAPAPAHKKSAPKKAEGQTSRKSRQPKDSNLELALALSLSLAQGEEPKGSLNAYGFASKSTGIKKSAPVLLRRTQAERERLITEKVAIVLMDEPESSQPSNNSQETRPTLQSAQLLQWYNQDHPLWKKTYTSPSQMDPTAFYVGALGNVIVPCKTEVGANLRHISQLPGRINTPKKNEKPEERPDGSSLSECLSTSNTLSLSKLEQDVKAKHLSDWASMLKNSSMSDVTIYVRGGLSIPAHKLVLGVRSPQVLRDVTKQQNQVTGLHVDVILWPDTSNDAAMCFLEYIYYGSIRSIHTLRKDMSGLQWLADRYEANDLTDVLSYFERRKRAVKSISNVPSMRSITPERQALSGGTSIRSRETIPIVNNLADTGSLESSDDKESEDMFLDEKEEEKKERNMSIHSRETEEKRKSPLSDHSIYSRKTVLPGRSQSPDPFSEEYDFELSPSPSGSTRNNAAGKLLDSTPGLKSNVPARIDGLSTVSPAKLGSISVEKSPERSSLGSKNTQSPQSAKSTNSLMKIGDTPKNPSPLKSSNVSPLSDLPAFDVGSQYPSRSQRFFSQRPGSPDDDVVIISDDEEEKKTVPEKPQDLMSMSTESFKSPKDPSPGRISPYISPIWDGFDDMPCDISMGHNWDDEPGMSPVQENRGSGMPSARETSPVQENRRSNMSSARETSPVQENRGSGMSFARETSPVHEHRRSDMSSARETSPVYKFQDISPLRNNKIHDISDSASSDDEPASAGSAGNVVHDSMLNDSMNAILASSILDRAEEQHLTSNRTLKRKRGDSGVDSGRVTPKKDYRKMTTPELKVELQNFGLKPGLGRRKGIMLLEHIYEKLHPLVPEDEGISQSQPTTAPLPSQHFSSQPNSSRAANVCPVDSSSSSSSSSSAEGLSDAEFADSDSDSGTVMSQRRTKTLSTAEIPNIVTKHIEKDRVLHRKILEYEPIFIENLHSDLKNNGYKFKIADLMAYLGEKCINYRSIKPPGSRTRKKSNQNGNQRKKRRANSDLADSNGVFY